MTDNGARLSLFSERHQHLTVGVVVIMGMLVSLIMFTALRSWTHERFLAEFSNEANARTELLIRTMEQIITEVEALSRFIQANGGTDAASFNRFTLDKAQTDSRAAFYAWLPHVSHDNRLDFEMDALSSGLSNYAILEGLPSVPAENREDYFPILYVASHEPHKNLLGWDMASEPKRRAALRTARDSGEISLSNPINLPIGGTRLAVFAPVYAGGVTPTTLEGRRQQLMGYALASLRGNLLRDSSILQSDAAKTLLAVQDDEKRTLFDEGVRQAGKDAPMLVRDLVIGDRTWQLIYTATPALQASQPNWMPWSALVLGLLLTFGYAVLTRKFIIQASRARQMAQSMHRERDAAEARFSSLFNVVPEGILVLDAKTTHITLANPAICQMLGYQCEELRRMPAEDLHPQDARQIAKLLFSKANSSLNRRVYEVPLLRKDASLFQADISCSQIKSGDQHLIAYMVTDASDRLSAQLFLEEQVRARTHDLTLSEARTRAILRTMQDGMVHIDEQGNILLVNEACCMMFGYEEEELVGQNVSLLMADPHRSLHSQYIKRYLDSRDGRIIGNRREVEGQRKDGQLFPMDLMVSEMVEDSGSTFIAVLRDITLTKDAMALLVKALSDAKTAAETKGIFLANMSHEIRTPINAILGFVHLCQHLELSARARDYVDKTRLAAESLLSIVNDILDFSKIEANKLELERIEFSLDEVLSSVGTLFGQKARAKRLDYAVGTMPDVPSQLIGDPLRLSQVLNNLVGNAIKFTEKGEIDLTVERLDDKDGTILLGFTVTDTGIGLSAEQRARLFNPFSQADSSTTRRFGGTGLGLAICKQLVEHMGGEINVASEPGVGSQFIFTARFGLNQSARDEKPANNGLAGKRVLVVDDNALMRTYITRHLEALSLQAEAVNSGEDALARLNAIPAIEVVLLDWQLTGMDGMATAQAIRDSGMQLPIVMITGFEAEVARTQAREGDIQAFLSKPVSRSTLRDTLASLLLGQAPAPVKPADNKPSVPNLAGRRILLVDDNDFNRQVGRELIELTGARVKTANDGQEAVDMVNAMNYDLVLMDIQMPVMDGYAASRIIRKQHPDVPVIALTAHALSEERQRCLQAGMSDVLNKPIVPNMMYRVLASWLNAHENRPPMPIPETLPIQPRQTEVALPASPAKHTPAPVQVTNLTDTELPVLDAESIHSVTNGDKPFYKRMLQMFLVSPVIQMDALHANLAENDLVKAHRQTHSLKGMAGSIGAKTLQVCATDLEKAFARGETNAELLAELERRLAATQAAIDAWLNNPANQ